MYSTAVVGAGMIGSSAARWAAELEPGGRVVLLGHGEGDGLPGAWADEGRITRAFDLRASWRGLAMESIQRYRDIEAEAGEQLFNEVGFISLIEGEASEAFLEAADVLQAEGWACEKVEGEAGAAAFPFLQLLPGVWGFHQPDRAGHLSPRGLVRAQQAIAVKRGCELVREGVETVQRDPQGTFALTLTSGRTVTAERVILATGAFLNLSGHLLPFLGGREVALSLTTQTVAYLRLAEGEAARLSAMPSIATNYTSGVLDGTYILPPIRYPDGHFYLKLGHGDHFERELTSLEEVEAWYAAGEGDREAVAALVAFIRGFIPGLAVEEVKGGCCVTSKTPTKSAPYIDEVVPGLVVAAGGCGHTLYTKYTQYTIHFTLHTIHLCTGVGTPPRAATRLGVWRRWLLCSRQ
jgi:sarcosine oxidase